MRIGIDLDNTLIDYTKAFLYGAQKFELIPKNWNGQKLDLKSLILSHYKGEHVWERLQGKVYGQWIHKAKLYAGVYRFLWRCRLRGWENIIVSHKTEYGHFDTKKISLRKAAINFLQSCQVWDSNGSGLLDEIRFNTTREKKIQTVEDLQCDVFIDDLPEVLGNKGFPNGTRRILFDPDNRYKMVDFERVQSWDDLATELLGGWNDLELNSLAECCGISSVKDVHVVSGGGNSKVFKVCIEGGKKFALKIYPPDNNSHDRLLSEFDGLGVIHSKCNAVLPKPVRTNRKLAVAAFEWVDGKSIRNPTKGDIIKAIDFLFSLHHMRNHAEFENFPCASDACLSGKDIEEQLNLRFELLLKEKNDSLNLFLTKDFVSLFEKMLDRAKCLWPSQGFELVLRRDQCTLSPSDFGFHNALRSKNNSLAFLDFEYFGWDDPVKLMCDFALHPGMELNREIRKLWFRATLKLYGAGLLPRLNASWPLYGLCWVLILLNEFRGDVWARRCAADPALTDSRFNLQIRQLERSRQLLIFIDHSVRTQTFDFM